MNEKFLVICLITVTLLLGGVLGFMVSGYYQSPVVGELEDDFYEAEHASFDVYTLSEFAQVYGVAIQHKEDFLHYVEEEGYEEVEEEQNSIFAARDLGCSYDEQRHAEFCAWEEIEFEGDEIIISHHKERDDE